MENKSKRYQLETVDKRCSERKMRNEKRKKKTTETMANLTPEDRNATRRTTTTTTTTCNLTLVLYSSRAIEDILNRNIDIIIAISITHFENDDIAVYRLVCSQLVIYRF